MSVPAKRDYPIKLGTLLFTMVEPTRGHELEYNRWYEHDHFYAGCMIGAWQFAGDRFVATRRLKDLRYPTETDMTPDPLTGSYLAIYWVLDGHHDEWNRWAVDQVNWLHANGRMFQERQHIHTLLYEHGWSKQRDPNGCTIELALDHGYPGLVVVAGDVKEGHTHDEVDRCAGCRARPVPPAPLPRPRPVRELGRRVRDRRRRDRCERPGHARVDRPVHQHGLGHRHLHRRALVGALANSLA
jgi:hypothetical protein